MKTLLCLATGMFTSIPLMRLDGHLDLLGMIIWTRTSEEGRKR